MMAARRTHLVRTVAHRLGPWRTARRLVLAPLRAIRFAWCWLAAAGAVGTFRIVGHGCTWTLEWWVKWTRTKG